VTSRDGTESMTYLVSLTKHMLVHENDLVRAGEALSDGQVSPQDILRILGPRAVQEYLVNEIQEVYRLQGVTINDKHIECIVRQMMQKVHVVDSGDTNLLEGDYVDRFTLEGMNDNLYDKFVVVDPGESSLAIGDIVDRRRLREINSDMKRHDKKAVTVRETQPAVAEPILLGITQASLSTDSFISAASFQETTKVLTGAAIAAKQDPLHGLKENVIVGHLIPAGTGQRRFRDIVVGSKRELAELQAALGTADESQGDGSKAPVGV
jgi:DNA-directed RNA polymerase subunit beta'